MKKIQIKVTKRENLGKKDTKNLRNEGKVPCVIYGGKETIHFYAEENDFRKIIYTPEVFLVELDIEGTIVPAVMQDIQFHPVDDKILHIDFIEVVEGKDTIVKLPIKVTGTSAGVLAGGKLRTKMRYLKAKGSINSLPETLNVDITPLEIGGSLKVRDLSYDGLELLDAESAVVVAVVTSRAAKAAEGEVAAEGEAAAEGEE